MPPRERRRRDCLDISHRRITKEGTFTLKVDQSWVSLKLKRPVAPLALGAGACPLPNLTLSRRTVTEPVNGKYVLRMTLIEL